MLVLKNINQMYSAEKLFLTDESIFRRNTFESIAKLNISLNFLCGRNKFIQIMLCCLNVDTFQQERSFFR